MKRIRTVAVFPVALTLGNLICGFFAIVVASRVLPDAKVPTAHEIAGIPVNPWGFNPSDPTHNIMLSAGLIFLAMVFDALDGHAARLAKTASDFGAQLDSLCDLVSFGVAPAILMVKMCPDLAYVDKIAMWSIAACFVGCVAMRLARFNAEIDDDDDHLTFTGLPCPAAAGTIASFAILFYTLRVEGNPLAYADTIDWWMRRFLPLFTLALSALMVSRIPYPHVVNQLLSGQRSLGHVVALLFSLVVILAFHGYSVPIVCSIFVLGPPLRYAWQRWRKIQAGQQETEPLF